MSAGDMLRRRWPLLLALSLVLIGFLAGMIAVDWLRPHRGAGLTGERAARFELRRLEKHLPADAVEQMQAALEPLAPSLEARLARLRDARAEVMRIAAEPQPDLARLETALAELRAESAGMQEEVQRATFDALRNSTTPGEVASKRGKSVEELFA